MLIKVIALICLSLVSGQALSQSRVEIELIERGGPNISVVWNTFTGISSAILANEGAELLASNALSWPDGRQAIVTFWATDNIPVKWSDAMTIRCIDYFNSSMQNLGGACSVPRSQN
jgi:hypothetical protein